MATKPSVAPRWAQTAGGVSATNVAAPTSGEQDAGFSNGQAVVSSSKVNWLLQTLYNWILYVQDAVFTATAGSGLPGVSATGDTAATTAQPGVLGTGGAGTTNGNGGFGLKGVGGAGAGTGVGGDGVNGTGSGAGSGLSGTGGASGPGATLTAGGGAAPVRGALALVQQNTPTTPANGDAWYDGTNIVARIAGVTKQILTTVSGVLARANLPAVGQQIASLASYTLTTTMADAGLSVTITTTGRPVAVVLGGGASGGSVALGSNGTNLCQVTLQLLRGATIVAANYYQSGFNGTQNEPATLFVLDTPAAGTYTYKLQGSVSSGTGVSGSVSNVTLTAYEL